MKKKINGALVLCLLLLIIIAPFDIFASSSYVLPYPSSMPGSLFYKPRLVLDQVMKYWYFGDFGQFKYNLKQSDKYLVEAKTLFEYKQYLLASKSLEKSNGYFNKIYPFLLNAEKNGKSILEKKKLLKEAGEEHVEVLKKLLSETPFEFTWVPEKEKSTHLNIHQLINKSIRIRKNYI